MEEKFEVIILKLVKHNEIIAHCISIKDSQEENKQKCILNRVESFARSGDIVLIDGVMDFLNDRDSYVFTGNHRKWTYPREYDELDKEEWMFTEVTEKPGFLDKLFYKNAKFTRIEGVAISKQGINKEFIIPRQKVLISKHHV